MSQNPVAELLDRVDAAECARRDRRGYIARLRRRIGTEQDQTRRARLREVYTAMSYGMGPRRAREILSGSTGRPAFLELYGGSETAVRADV